MPPTRISSILKKHLVIAGVVLPDTEIRSMYAAAPLGLLVTMVSVLCNSSADTLAARIFGRPEKWRRTDLALILCVHGRAAAASCCCKSMFWTIGFSLSLTHFKVSQFLYCTCTCSIITAGLNKGKYIQYNFIYLLVSKRTMGIL